VVDINYEKMFDEFIEKAKSTIPPDNSFTKKEFIEKSGLIESQARTFLRKQINLKLLLVMEYRGVNYYYFPA
jgi:hypothetical protein